MQKKRKTHQEVTEEDVNKVPHSFVMHKGEVGKSVLQLEMDIRHVMEPYTATKCNKSKSYVGSIKKKNRNFTTLGVRPEKCFLPSARNYVMFVCEKYV